MIQRAAVLLTVLTMLASGTEGGEPLKALIMDGQNNHEAWPKTTFMMKHYLEETGLFTVDLARTQYTWKGESHLGEYSIDGISTEALPQPKTDPDFRPKFADYAVVVSNFGFNAAPWPEATQSDFVDYVASGGGVVIVHAADNSFGDWETYNRIIGIGGWGGRDESTGPYIYLDEDGKVVRNSEPGRGGHHGSQHEFAVVTRDLDHPITRGMPREWMHTKDELYEQLRGPGQQMQILATAYASPEFGGSGRHEPMLMTVKFKEGRIFHTPLGHADYSQECVGFKVVIQRGAEWAATGAVTQEIPNNFPTAEKISSEEFKN